MTKRCLHCAMRSATSSLRNSSLEALPGPKTRPLRKVWRSKGHHLSTKLVAGTLPTQLTSTLFGASKNDRAIA